MRCSSMVLFILVGVGCTEPEKESSDDSGSELIEEGDSGSGVDTNDDDDNGSMPPNPGPFTIDLVHETLTQSLNFDLPTCQHFRGSTNFRAFWRDEARSHTYVLTMQVMSTFAGAGTYSSADHRVDFKLLEEAPMTGAPTYYTDSAAGDATEIEVTHIDEEVAWGSATITGLHTTDGFSVTMSPTTVSIWCPDVEI
ncbi:MAG: hypothetical protein ACPGTU_01190 [Myxococcota bacterium]